MEIDTLESVVMALAASGLVGHGAPGRARYQARVAAMASASGVPAVPNAAWYLLVARPAAMSGT